MKKSFYLILFMAMSQVIFGQIDYKLSFQKGEYQDFLTQAKSENKVLIIEFSERMDYSQKVVGAYVFNDEKLAQYVHSQFILMRVNKKEDKDNLIKKFGVYSFPSYVFIDGNERIVYRLLSDFTRETFLKACSSAQTPEDNFLSWKEMLASKDINPEFLYRYGMALKDAGEPYREVADRYFESIGNQFVDAPFGIEAVLNFTEDFSDIKFKILVESWNAIDHSPYNEVMVAQRMSEVISKGFLLIAEKNKKVKLEDTLNGFFDVYPSNFADFTKNKTKMLYYKKSTNIDEYQHAIVQYLFSGIFYIKAQEKYDLLSYLAEECQNEDLNRQAIHLLMELISQDNRTEYQEILALFNAKMGMPDEADRALEVLVERNIAFPMYTNEEIEAIRNKVEASKAGGKLKK